MSWLTEEQKQQFQTKGYLIIENALSVDEVQTLEAECARLVDESDDSQAEYYYEADPDNPDAKMLRRIERLSYESPVFKALFEAVEIRGRVSELFGEPALLFKDKLNLKLPGGDGFRAHVDGHFKWIDHSGAERRGWQDYGSHFINALVCIDHANIENGCLQCAPLYQTFEHLGETYDEIAASVDGNGPFITDELSAKLDWNALETKPGDLILFDWRNVHGSNENRSDHSRRIVYATYNAASDGDQQANYYNGKRSSRNTASAKALG